MNSDNMFGFDRKAKGKDRGKYVHIAFMVVVRSLCEHCDDVDELDAIIDDLKALESRALAIRKQPTESDGEG